MVAEVVVVDVDVVVVAVAVAVAVVVDDVDVIVVDVVSMHSSTLWFTSGWCWPAGQGGHVRCVSSLGR